MKLARENGILFNLCYFVPKDISISVYYSLFYTHVIYGFVSFGSILEKAILIIYHAFWHKETELKNFVENTFP